MSEISRNGLLLHLTKKHGLAKDVAIEEIDNILLIDAFKGEVDDESQKKESGGDDESPDLMRAFLKSMREVLFDD